MKYISVGDMSQTYLLRRHNSQLKTTMTRLNEEMITGIAKDLGAAVGGDFTALTAINHSLARSEIYAQVATETDLLAGTQQSALEIMQGHAYEVGSTLVSAASATNPTMINSGATDAAVRFESIIDALNVSVAGRYVFSGVTTDTRPVADADQILGDLQTYVASETTTAGIVSKIDEWFDAPALSPGFTRDAYAGSATTLSPMRLSEADTAQITITATDPALRNLLKGFALASMISQDMLPVNDVTSRATLLQKAGEQIITADGELSTLRSQLGTVEGIIAEAQTRNSAQKQSLELAKTELIGVDPYDSATALEAVQSQIETLYTLTSRIQKLSLTDYL